MSEATAEAVAAALLNADCFKVNIDRPFRLVSGLQAPFYMDCRHVLAHPPCRTIIADQLAARTRTLERFEVIAGGVTAGVPFATLLADRLEMPLAYVRAEPKAHGLGSQVEGAGVDGRRVLLIEDVMTTGESSLQFVRTLHDHGAEADACIVVLDRSKDGNAGRFAEARVTLHSLCTMDSVLRRALADELIGRRELGEIQAFLDDPTAWSARRDHG